ncbi:MAG: hypothetical protein ABSG81_05840 [Acidimicrobiales bacterium]
MRLLARLGTGVVVLACCGFFLAACSSAAKSGTATTTTATTVPGSYTTNATGLSGPPTSVIQGGSTTGASYLVYWDQNEEEDFLSMPSGTQGQLVPPWDPNGQMCLLPDGRFVVGYDPTLPAQDNLGSAKPYKQPADGEELDEPNGSFSGQTLYVPGPYKMPGQSIGSDSPPTSNGVFNNNQTYTGCAVEKNGNVLGNDIATAQGDYPPESSGRLVEWFAPSYTTYCIVYGPDAGGTGPHHTDGTGGLAQPGMMNLADNGDVLVPNVGTSSVLRFAQSSLPTSAAQCPGGLYPRSKLHISTFVKVPFPAGVAKDPTCGCFAVSSYIGNPSVRWFTAEGKPEPGRTSLPGTSAADLGKSPDQYNPFGMAFAPDGTLYFIDIHIVCKALLTGCGPGGNEGRAMRVTFSNGQPSTPVAVNGGFDFPTSVTVCVPSATQVCPYPTGKIVAPLSGPSENPAPDAGPPSNAPGTAGFG